jgi:predicted nucleotidyltransferase
MVDTDDIQAIIDQIVRYFHPKKVVLFGSYAYGVPSQDSDVDLLVVMDYEGGSALKSVEILNAVNPSFAIDLLVRTPEQVRQRIKLGDFFMKEIIDKGKVLYEATYA